GIDNMSVIIRSNQLANGKEERIIERIRTELEVGEVDIEHDLAMIMVVGEGMNDMVGIAAKAATALADVGVNIKMINQGSSEVSVMLGVKADIKMIHQGLFEVSVMFGVKADDVTKAVRSLYNMFFKK